MLTKLLRQEHHHLCDIKALGVHPLIQVQDIRCEGAFLLQNRRLQAPQAEPVSLGLSKTFLWQLFSLDRFNAVLKEIGPHPNTHPVSSEMTQKLMVGPD